MNKLLFYVCIALAIFGCSGDMNDLPGLGGERKCGDILYNATDSNMRCQNDVAESRCGQTWYDISDPDLICTGDASYGILLTRCGTREYSNPYEDYYENPQNYFDASVQFCLDNAIYYKCGGREYDASTQYCSGNALSTYDSVKYGGQSYKTVVIGKQIWMAENLNYNPGTGNSVCYRNQASYCDTYGRLYDWATAMNLGSSCNSSSCSTPALQGIRGICPDGWHIPSNGDWDVLFRYVDGTESGTESPYSSETAGRNLKAASGWIYYNNDVSANGTNSHGFSALPGGSRMNSFDNAGYYGYWWSASENSSYAYYRDMSSYNSNANASYTDKSYLYSVRCIQDKCDGKDYNPVTHLCHSDGETYSCGSKPFSPVAQFCLNGEAYDKCDGQEYNPSTQRCNGSVIQTRCGTGNNYYDPSTQFCSGNLVYSKCNGQTYDISTQRCNAGVIETRCGTGNDYYDPSTQFCMGNDVYEICNGRTYNPSEYFCSGGALHSTCNGQSYDISTQRCNAGVIETRCGNTYFVSSTHFCHGTSFYEKCGGVYTYDPDTQFCYGTSYLDKCNGQEYDPSTQYCSGNALSTYDSVKYGDQSYKTVVIGTQTWFAENLNYDVSDNDTDVCYNNDPANCTKYGRLYDWATAMGLETNCNNGDCSEHINTSHQGICPSGWHIPSQDEWNTLSSYVESNSGCSNCDAGKLKTASGWYNNGNGTNKYGFSALPGGSRMNSFGNASYYGSWWSASEYDGSRAYYRDMLFNDDGAYWYDDFKSYLFSVRCLQN